MQSLALQSLALQRSLARLSSPHQANETLFSLQRRRLIFACADADNDWLRCVVIEDVCL